MFVLLVSISFVLAVPEISNVYATQNDGISGMVSSVSDFIYVNYSNVEFHGTVNSPELNDIVDIKYRRGVKDWETANWNYPNSVSEDWWSRLCEEDYSEGEHSFCVRATDSAGLATDGSDCYTLCVDMQVPDLVSNIVLDFEWNFSWGGGVDNGCSGIYSYFTFTHCHY